MENLLANLLAVIKSLNSVLWGPVLIVLLCGTGLYFTLRLNFVQIREFKTGFKAMFGDFSLSGKKAGKGGMSSFQAAMTSIAAQVGTGNLAGAATAIVSGGPGAVFWMWVSAFFGMATIYVEAALGQRYKQKADGQIVGGPAYYIEHGIKNKKLARFLAVFFSVTVIIALGITGNMVQANSIGVSMSTVLHTSPVIVGIVLAVLAGFIFIGGIGRIASITEKIVPVMAVVYIVGALIVIIMNIGNIPEMFRMIFVGAFNPRAIVGGGMGIAVSQSIRYGVARGLFSNEAGMGSTPHSHAIAKSPHPGQQGAIAVVCVFIDTFIILTLTAMVILLTGAYEPTSATNLTSIDLTQAGFANALGSNSNIFVTICLFFFAFSTIIGWYFFGESNVKYLFGKKGLTPYRIFVLIAIVLGASLKVELVWELADFFNGLMVMPNLIALLLLSPMVVKITKDFRVFKETGSSADKDALSPYQNEGEEE